VVKKERAVCNYERVIAGDGFIRDRVGEVDGEQDGVPVARLLVGIEGRFEQEPCIIEGLVC